MRNYPRISIQEFGEHLLRTNDLDPIYVALNRCRVDFSWPREQLGRWLVAYWCLYHAGAASWLCELENPNDYWAWLGHAATNDHPTPMRGRWPRGHERRHFRGKAGERAVDELKKRYGPYPHEMVDYVGLSNVGDVMRRVKEHYLFGDWIAFKVADMLDRCLGVSISFDQGHVFMFPDPIKAAMMLWRQTLGLGENAKPKDLDWTLGEIVRQLQLGFAEFKAPPLYDRPVGLQEVETILCKWKSHMNGHYPLWNDIDDINDGLDPWTGESEAAAAFAVAMPKREVEP